MYRLHTSWIRGPLVAAAAACLAGAPALAGTISGVVKDSNGNGIVGVDLDVFDAVTGVKLVTPNDKSQTGGDFLVTVPNGVYRVAFDTAGIVSPVLAPKEVLNVVVTGAKDMGTIVLAAGIVVTGKVTNSGGSAVADADIDLLDAVTGAKAYTPSDNTNGAGEFRFYAAKGSYRVKAEPPVATKLVATIAGPFSMQSSTNVGTISVSSGSFLSGKVTTSSGAPLAGIDIDVRLAGTTTSIPMANDTTDAAGNYQVVVPAALIDVTFNPPVGSALATALVTSVNAASDAVVHAALSAGGIDPNPTELILGQTFAGAFATSAEVDEVSFEAAAGLRLTVDAKRKSGTALPTFELVGPSGNPVSTSGFVKSSALGTKLTSLPLVESGSYKIRFFPAAGGTGTYTARITVVAPPTWKLVKAAVNVAAADAVVEVPIEAVAGSKLTGKVTAPASSGLVPAIVELRAPDGSAVDLTAQLTTKGKSVSIVPAGILLAQSGTYLARISGANATTGTGSASFKLTLAKPPAPIVTE